MRTSGQGFIKKIGPHRLGGIILLLFLVFSCTQNSNDQSLKEGSQISPDLSRDLNLDSTNYNVAFLIMDGVYNTELTAPYDIFHHTIFRDGIRPMNVFTIAKGSDPITTFEGIRLIPDLDYSSNKLPRIDILVVPSAENHLGSDLEDKEMLQLVKNLSEKASFVMSHCDGAFVLAEAGVLDERESTTFPADIQKYRDRYPNLIVHDSVLFVHDGKFITSAGGARSFEASLYLVEVMYGKKIADEIAEGMVIDWNKESISYVLVGGNNGGDKSN